MLLPSKLLITSNLKNNIPRESYLSNATDKFRKLKLADIKYSNNVCSSRSQFRPLILKLISDYQKAKIHDVSNLRITVHMKARNDVKQLPATPKTSDRLPEYVFDLVGLLEYELTKTNRDKKQKIIDSFISNVEDLKAIDNGTSVLLKSILVESIIRKQFNQNIYDQLDFDIDVFYILCFKYFMNPLELDSDTRFVDLISCINNYGETIDKESWEFLNQLTTKNILAINVRPEINHSPIFNKMISIIDGVDACYNEFNLLGMLRVLRNAETGYEGVIENDVIKFDIGYYRYLTIDRALCEWNKNSLTLDIWERYNFKRQWKTIWEVYYEGDNSICPGGPTTMKHVYKIVSA